MRSTCPPEWSSPNVRAACETVSENNQDPIASFPVTDLSDGVTYRNFFCAACHRAKNLEFWKPTIVCYDIPYSVSTISRDELINSLSFNDSMQLWEINFENEAYYCTVSSEIPNKSKTFIRRCIPYDIKTCPQHWSNNEVRSKCEDYTSVIYSNDTSYRNPHCALCNNALLSDLKCYLNIYTTTPSSFSIPFDLSGGPPGMTQPCDDDMLYDPFFKRCRKIVEELQLLISSEAPYFSMNQNIGFASIMNCEQFLLNKNNYTIYDKTVYVEKYRKRFGEGAFYIIDNGRLEICSDIISVKSEHNFSRHIEYISLCGLVVSIICLILHLTAFCLVPDLRNHPGRNMASLCLALLVAYISSVAGMFLEGGACFVVAVLAFYFFLASFIWMLTISFDVWRTLKLSTSQLRVCSGKQWHKFIAYSLFSWLVPALVVMLAIWMEYSPIVEDDWKPGFDFTTFCWFTRIKPWLAFFAAPFAIVMFLNIIFFTNSFCILYSTKSTRPTPSTSTERNFRLYLRLTVMMGLTWTTGVIGILDVVGILDSDLLWYLFILLNALHGLFIFLAFTCKYNVISLIHKQP
ncbi:G-protein coupled receptor Mth2-like [Halyomorpha halys]|uniref:G-protein coupled receptor Mth2-like n=1 Tax=Halyomorpha halys TaxID=286706 RepID=UPI0006D4F6BD